MLKAQDDPGGPTLKSRKSLLDRVSTGSGSDLVSDRHSRRIFGLVGPDYVRNIGDLNGEKRVAISPFLIARRCQIGEVSELLTVNVINKRYYRGPAELGSHY